MRTVSNWDKYGENHFLGIRCYRGCDGRWYAENRRKGVIVGSYSTRRAARIGAYETLG